MKATAARAASNGRITDRWDDAVARGLSALELLRYRSNLLGADLRITNFGGGNTSAKIQMPDPLTGQPVDVLWVKGSGGDLGSATLEGFASLYLDKLRGLTRQFRGRPNEDDMPGLLPHCTFNLNPRATSIDTPLHAFIPHAHIDHVHADAIIAIAAARHGERLMGEIFGNALAWVPWQRPGFDLGLTVGQVARERPGLDGIILGGHGLLTWGPTSEACYRTSLRVIQQAADWLDAHATPAPFGPQIAPAMDAGDRARLLDHVAPALRGLVSPLGRKVLHYADSPAALMFAGSARVQALAERGTTCPDHFLRTRVRPLVVPFDPGHETAGDLLARLPACVERYREDYTAYYDRCRRPHSPAMRDPYPVITIIPGLGLLSFQSDKTTARVATEFYESTIRIMRWAEGVDEYAPIAEQEAFDIEYWALEAAKLRRLPAAGPLSGRVALVTGGAGGIGSAIARGLLADGAAIVLVDRDEAALHRVSGDLTAAFGGDRVRVSPADVTREAMVAAAFASALREYGGVDILVANAGIASASPVEETSLDIWEQNQDVLATGYFLASREAFRVMKAQGVWRIDRLRRQQERASRVRRRGRLLRGQGRRRPPGAVSGPRRRAARHPRQRREPRRGDPRISHLGRRLARRARGQPRHSRRRGGGVLPSAQPPEAERLPGRRRGRRALLCVGPLRQVHRQHAQRGRGPGRGVSTMMRRTARLRTADRT